MSNTRINTQSEAVVSGSNISERDLGNEIVLIDEAKMLEKGMVCVRSNGKRYAINDQFRAVKHRIVHNAFSTGSGEEERSNLIMVTSSTPNEGKTFCCVNLALMLSLEKNKSVLLVDADVLNPSVNKLLEIDNRPGLIDYLNGDVNNVEDVIYNTSIPNIRIMPSGDANHLSYELLASDKMFNLAQELANRYSDRIVLFDCPPILGVIETISLSKLVGQVVVVVEENVTKISLVKEAVSLLDTDLPVGFVVNKSVRSKSNKYGYGYGYGYGNT